MRCVAAALLVLACSCPASAGEVLVAVAANFAGPIARIGAAFTAGTGHVLKVSTASTGKFHAQIVGGAPFEVLLAADGETPARLDAQGHAVAGTRFTYAIGKLVLWSARPGLVDDQGAVLASGRFKHLAVANPKTAPYGAAAHQVLKARGLEQALAPRLVTGESIAQAYQFVATGNAEIGFVALSQVMQPGKESTGSMWRVPEGLYTAMRQDAVLLKAGAGNPAAWALLEFLKGAAARQIMRDHGYGH